MDNLHLGRINWSFAPLFLVISTQAGIYGKAWRIGPMDSGLRRDDSGGAKHDP